jgi:hypothetical protein
MNLVNLKFTFDCVNEAKEVFVSQEIGERHVHFAANLSSHGCGYLREGKIISMFQFIPVFLY